MELSTIIALMALLVAFYYSHKGAQKGNWDKTIEHFKNVRKYPKLPGKEKMLIEKAYNLYKDNEKNILIENVPLLVNEDWFPHRPVPLEKIKLSFYKGEVEKQYPNIIRKLRKFWPYDTSGKKYKTYSQAINEADLKGIFVNNPSYRLVNIEKDQEDDTYKMEFTLAHYYDNFDIGGALGYEFAHYELLKEEAEGKNPIYKLLLEKRKRYIRNKILPFDLNSRFANPGIVTLTIRKTQDDAGFFLQLRNSNVAISEGQYSVIPAGEFQPSTSSPINIKSDLDIWKNIMREYNEEILGAEEVYGDAGYTIDYQKEEPYKSLNDGRKAGKVKVYYLGTTIQPLALKTEILTVCVFEHDFFDKVFKDFVYETNEGRFITGTRELREGTPNGIPKGISFDEESIEDFENNCATVPSTLGCLKLTWKYRKELGLDMTCREPV